MKWDHMRLKLKRRGHALNDFRYACAGCSVYMSRNKGSVDRGGDSPELPGCAGIQVKFCTCPFLDGGWSRVYLLVAYLPIDESSLWALWLEDVAKFLVLRLLQLLFMLIAEKVRFANLVASGVARNMCRVGNYMKETVDDILFTNRKRPK
ncbi:hypothetical protein QQP08_003779 [Theobroma cacao]|nr:hypothetical protein QQP08_003779 [Theobroma cacao]